MKKCIRVQCFCGLGNQLFQYACGRAIQEKYGGIDALRSKCALLEKIYYNKLNKDIKI